MVAGWAFVDSVSASPTVLLNLHDRNPIHVEQWDAPSPNLRRSVSTSMLFDGGLEAGSVYQDRELDMTLFFATQGEDAAASTFQALTRILNAPSWLRYTPDGATNSVFFRTRRVPPSELEEFRGVAGGAKRASLSIPAEPFAYGLPETANLTVNNDPTAGTNPQGFTMPAVKGDVAAPLRLDMSRTPATTAAGFIASRSGPGLASTLLTQSFTISGINWSGASSSDVTTIGGSYTNITRSSGTSQGQIQMSFTGLRGDYRVLARARNGTISTSKTGPYASAGLTFAWRDLGIVRLPGGSSKTDARFTAAATETLPLTLYSDSPIGLDAVQIIPAGLDCDVRNSLLKSSEILATSTVDDLTDTTLNIAAIEGGPPWVTPGATNRISLILGLGVGSTIGDNLSWASVVNWTYYPRYLYTRPATS